MPVFQFRCSKCFSVFEHFVSTPPKAVLVKNVRGANTFDVSCVSCGSGNVSRYNETAFHPSKIFCPHEKEMEDGFSYGNLKQVLMNHAEECTSPKCGGRGSCNGKCGSCR
jgi:hypothetical protein